METKRQSIMHKVIVILLIVLILNFAGGSFALYRLEKFNADYIYRLTGELINTSIKEMEEQLEEIQTIIYDIIVSDVVQRAGSRLIENGSNGNTSGVERSNSLNDIADCIQREISLNHSIVFAEFIDDTGKMKTVASTRYYRLSQEAVDTINQTAIDADGDTVFLDASNMVGDKNIMLVAKQVREKKNFSLKHIGVIALFVDMENVGSMLTETHDGTFLLTSNHGELKYVLNDEEDLQNRYISDDRNQSKYFIWKKDRKTYFVVSIKQPSRQFSYTIITPYSNIFRDVWNAFILYTGIFLLCGIVVMLISLIYTNKVTRDIRLFIQHISNIPGEDFTKLPLYEKEDIQDKDVYALQKAFNSMSTSINELLYENHTKQLMIMEARLHALQAQMNPHFLYNTLNSVCWMAKVAGMTAAADMISSLSYLIREAISNQESVITIDQELDIVCHYFIIQKHRFEERLEVRFDVSDKCSNLIVPKFIIQPLAENAIAYGLENMLEKCTIEINVYLEQGDCICQVKNTGPKPEENLMEKLHNGTLTPKGNGIGLLNIEQRIKYVFGDEYGITVFRAGEKTVAQVRMKRISLQEYEERCQNGKRL